VIPETNVEFQDFWNLTHRGDNGSLNEINPPLFPEFHEFGTISDIHPAATSLIHPELESFSWPDAKTSQATIGVGMIHDIDAVEPELSSHTLHELYVWHQSLRYPDQGPTTVLTLVLSTDTDLILTKRIRVVTCWTKKGSCQKLIACLLGQNS
jgi:hypothetical protein